MSKQRTVCCALLFGVVSFEEAIVPFHEKRRHAVDITFTEKAAEKAKALLEEKGPEYCGLRVFVVGGGCSGYQYGMAFVKAPDQEDFVIEQRGVKLIVDPESAPLLDGAEIDYQDDLMKSGFTIHNPNAVRSCACGQSFGTEEGGGCPRPCGH